MQPLTDVLTSEKPTALRRIEDALGSLEERGEAAEAALTSLIWRRRVNGSFGILATFAYTDCTKRISVIPQHLDHIGATESAAAVRWLRRGVPFDDDRIVNGIIDWLEENKTLTSRAQKYDRELDDIAPCIWRFMQSSADAFSSIEIPEKRLGFLSRLLDLGTNRSFS
ncbi:hypothetical protein P1J78_24555 [Psychromarinibacter sp. C21-152]|uniref:Uncharacterized protein n=1 Tax=Psychromarinibacter sediminicola TaxID=3033385 RepID=A0AAE3NX70_9RHOB|nr:hypothetical protein [Psychromarinibacter sediminicola]MDF0603889.1 hypothetical protein [Psychromarinibacter sediminicola]